MIGVKEKKEYWGQEIRQKMKNFLSYFVILRQFLTGGVSFEMLLNYMIYPQHYISQKSIEMFSWIMKKNDSLIPLLIKYCQSDNL